jgi:dolichol-phosphate mannosyltransferase
MTMAPATISIIVPTYNEAANIEAIHDGIGKVLADFRWELIVVDDHSPDRTADIVRRLAQHRSNVRCIERIQDRGLCSAVQWGVQSAHGDIIVVMDGDLQHDARLIPLMCEELAAGHDVVSASRFLSGGDIKGLPSDARRRLSAWGNRLVGLFLGRELTDPLTGFFATSRALFMQSIPRMKADGFKIFFDLIYYNRRAVVKEVALEFQPRQGGESKLQFFVLWLLACDMVSKLTLGLIPPQFISFVTVGLIGSSVHFSILYGVLTAGADFWIAQTVATVCAMVSNFTINNVLTYSTYRLTGLSFVKGLLLYSAIASFGIVANVSSAQITYSHFKSHVFFAATVGIVIDIVWRFVVSSRLIWGRASMVRPVDQV